MKKIFVYGTLKRDLTNHRYLAGQTFLGEARTKVGYRMYDAGGYPGLVADNDNPLSITGEVWQVDDASLKKIDRLEGLHLRLYAREVVPLEPPFDQDSVEAYVYIRPVKGLRDVGPTWTE